MKYYEELAKKSEKLQSVIAVLIAFLIGYILGYYTMQIELKFKNTINNQTEEKIVKVSDTNEDKSK